MKPLLLLGSIIATLAVGANLQFAKLSAVAVNSSSKEEGIDTRMTTFLVVVNVSVVESDNRRTPDLTNKDFVITENGVRQEIGHFIGADRPLSISLAFNISDSDPLKLTARQTARSLLDQIRSTDEVIIPQLKADRELVRDFIGDKQKLEHALSNISLNEKSPLFDVISDAINSTNEKRIYHRGITIVITDGLSLSGTAGDKKAAYAILREGAPIYFIILDDGRYGSSSANRSKVQQTRNLLTRIAEVSGGQAVVVKSENEIPAATGEIITRLKNQYTIGYYPTNEKFDGSFRSISVAATPKDKRKVKVFAPMGYYAADPEKIRKEKPDDK